MLKLERKLSDCKQTRVFCCLSQSCITQPGFLLSILICISLIRHRNQLMVNLDGWFMEERSESPPELPTRQEFCLAGEVFLPLEEALHPREYAITAFHRVHLLLVKTKETGLDKFSSIKAIMNSAIMNSARVRNSGAAASDIPEGLKQSITSKCEVYDELVKLLEGYQEYPADHKGESIFWTSVFDIMSL